MINPKYEYLREYVERIPKDFETIGTVIHSGFMQTRCKFRKSGHYIFAAFYIRIAKLAKIISIGRLYAHKI